MYKNLTSVIFKSVFILVFAMLIIACSGSKGETPAPTGIAGNWSLNRISDTKGSDFTNTLASCDKSTIWQIGVGDVSVKLPTGCTSTNTNYVNRFENGFTYKLNGSTLTLTESSKSNILTGNYGGSATFNVSFSGNEMTWTLVNNPNYSYNWVFVKQ